MNRYREPAPHDEPSAGNAFLKGGIGCIVAFFVLGFSCVAMGGSLHADLGGLIFLFVIGGGIGLVVFAIYNKGRRDAAGTRSRGRDRRRPPRPPHTDVRSPDRGASRSHGMPEEPQYPIRVTWRDGGASELFDSPDALLVGIREFDSNDPRDRDAADVVDALGRPLEMLVDAQLNRCFVRLRL